MPEEPQKRSQQQDSTENPGAEAPEEKVSGREHFTPESVPEEHSHLGPILGVLIIVLVLILGGLYLWGSTLVNEPAEQTAPREIENNEPETPRAEADAAIYETTSSSDELSAIEADLESTNLAELDAELQAIEQELE